MATKTTVQESTLTKLARERSAQDMAFLGDKSYKWFQNKVRNLRNPTARVKEIIAEPGRNGRILEGGLYHFMYDPKHKDTLPYYDNFPLIIMLGKYNDGFLGLNLHYLPIQVRAAFMDKLTDYALWTPQGEPRRLRVTYDILVATSRYAEFKFCIKRYLSNHIRSKIIVIQPPEWETALFLPTAQWQGASMTEVYTDYKKQMGSPNSPRKK
jgi:hypothetical protein